MCSLFLFFVDLILKNGGFLRCSLFQKTKAILTDICALLFLHKIIVKLVISFIIKK